MYDALIVSNEKSFDDLSANGVFKMMFPICKGMFLVVAGAETQILNTEIA